jgi:hypothetical protein
MYFTTNKHENQVQNQYAIWGLCIPKVDINISRDYIQTKLKQTNLGHLKQYTEIPWKNDPNYKRILMRIQWNKHNPNESVWKETLNSGKAIHIVYEYPYIWKLYLAKN